jgi:hypothetical protein
MEVRTRKSTDYSARGNDLKKDYFAAWCRNGFDCVVHRLHCHDDQVFVVLEGTLIVAGFKRVSVDRSNGFVKRRENPRLPDCCRDAMPIHVGS